MNIKTEATPTEAAELGATAQDIAMQSLVLDPALQPRGKVNQQKVNEYATALAVAQGKSPFPPIEVMRVGDKLFVVDGWHRFHAHERRGAKTISAVITEGTMQGAKRAAAMANTRHGLQLTRADKRRAFRLYVQGRGHLDQVEGVKSSRQIASDLGGMVGHVTIISWFKEDFPKIYARISSGLSDPHEEARTDLEAGEVRAALAALERVTDAISRINNPQHRWTIYQDVEALCGTLSTWNNKPIESYVGDEFDTPFQDPESPFEAELVGDEL